MLNHTINLDFSNKIYGMINMEAIPKFDIKSDIKFDISIKLTTWIGHELFSKTFLVFALKQPDQAMLACCCYCL